MSVLALLEVLQARGVTLTPEGNTIRYRAPKGVMNDAMRAQIQEHKAELLAWLTRSRQEQTPPPPLGKVGRHGPPCPHCGDTWQWPTTSGKWVCSWCVAGRQGTPQIAPAGTVDTTARAPDGLRTLTGADGRVWTITVYRCPRCGGTNWGPKVDDPDTWWCLACHGGHETAPAIGAVPDARTEG